MQQFTKKREREREREQQLLHRYNCYCSDVAVYLERENEKKILNISLMISLLDGEKCIYPFLPSIRISRDPSYFAANNN